MKIKKNNIEKVKNEYKLYIWLDADMWLNDVDSFSFYEKGAFNDKLSIVPQSDRAYVKNANVEWLFGFPKKIKTINYKNISKSISKSLGRKYAFHSTLNAGAFAINDNVNIWKCFQKNIKLAAKKGRIFGTDQVALALSIYEDNIPSEFLPAYCNWMCEFNMPKFDSAKGQFVEPYIPNHPIALVHLAGLDDIRMDKNILQTQSQLRTLALDMFEAIGMWILAGLGRLWVRTWARSCGPGGVWGGGAPPAWAARAARAPELGQVVGWAWAGLDRGGLGGRSPPSEDTNISIFTHFSIFFTIF